MTNLVFGIPLRSATTAQSWETVTRLLESTLRSVLAQTDGRFYVVLACHELPEIDALADPRIMVMRADFPAPRSLEQQMADKARKRRLIAAAFRRLGGGYLMMVDADDLVSNRLAAHVHAGGDPHGYVLKRGYELDLARDSLRATPRFNRICGSSAVIRFAAEELPDSDEDETPRYFSQFTNHRYWEEMARRNGRPLRPLPFRGAVYVLNHGENYSVQAHERGVPHIGWRRRLVRRLTPDARLTEELRREFGIARPLDRGEPYALSYKSLP